MGYRVEKSEDEWRAELGERYAVFSPITVLLGANFVPQVLGG